MKIKARLRPYPYSVTLLFVIVFSCSLIWPADTRSRDKESRRRSDRVSSSGSATATLASTHGVQNQVSSSGGSYFNSYGSGASNSDGKTIDGSHYGTGIPSYNSGSPYGSGTSIYGSDTADGGTGYPSSGYISGSSHASTVYNSHSRNSNNHGRYSSGYSAPKLFDPRNYKPPAKYVTGSNLYNIDTDLYSEPTNQQYNDSTDFAFTGQRDPTGFCVRRRDMKLMCYCTPDEHHVQVRKAECWVFSDSLQYNDTTWTRFFQQKRLRDLKIVVQNHGRLEYVPTAVLKVLRNITSILIEYSQVEVLAGHSFANLQYVEIIILTNNRISTLAQNCFANHVRLRELNLELNQIKTIDRFAFRNLPSMERLHLNNNNLSRMQEAIFVDMPHLLYLNIAHNRIRVLTRDLFVGLGNLNVLVVANNRINFIGDTIFIELWSLSDLDLSNNRIQGISERALDGLNSLKVINLSNNNLVKMDPGILRGTPALLAVNLLNNKLITLSFLTFQPIMDNLINSSGGELQLANNNFLCDCRLQWLFDLRNRTQQNPLREALGELVCTLQDPNIGHFEEPVPTHILDQLNIGGYKVTDEDNSAALTAADTVAAKKQTARTQQRQVAPVQLLDDKLVADVPLVKRSLSSEMTSTITSTTITSDPEDIDTDTDTDIDTDTDTNIDNDTDIDVEAADDATDDAAEYQISNTLYKNNFKKIRNLRDDYYDDAAQLYGGGGDNSQKPHVLFGQQAQLATDTNELEYVEPTESTETPMNFSGIKVHLFAMKADALPCPEEALDPTELPLSRDLMDGRRNNNTAAATTALGDVRRRRVVVAVSAVVVTMVGAGLAVIRIH